MKDYDRYVLWLDYFNSEAKRREGRRVPLSTATKAPRLEELEEACRKLDLQPVAQQARYPGLPSRESGYISVAKAKPKQSLVLRVAKELSSVRGLSQKHQPPGPAAQKKRADA
jgi:signal recognition particle subunit SRP19